MIHTRVAVTLSMYGHHEVVKSKDSWERTHAGAILLAKKYPESIWCQNAAAFVGLRRNDRELCVQTLPVVEKNQVKALWTPRNFEMYVSFARPKIPPPPPVFIRAGETKSLAFLSKTGQLAAVGGRGLKTVSIWDADAKEPAATHPLKTLNVFAFDPTDEGGSIFLAYSLLDQPRNVAAVMNATTGEVQVISDDETKHIRTGDVSPDGKLVATIDGMLGENVTVWDVPGRKALQRLPHKGSQDRVEFSPDGQYLAVVARENTRIWNWKQKKEVLTVLAGQDPVKLGDYDEAQFVDFRGEQAIFHAYSFARAEEYSFVACDLDDHKLHVLVRTGKFRTESCRLSPNKQLVAAIYSPENFQPPKQGVQVWDLEHGKLLGEIPPMHLEGRQQVAFSPDSSKLALCSPSPRGFEVFEISKLTSK